MYSHAGVEYIFTPYVNQGVLNWGTCDRFWELVEGPQKIKLYSLLFVCFPGPPPDGKTNNDMPNQFLTASMPIMERYMCMVNLFLCLTDETRRHEDMYGGVDMWIHVFLPPALIGGERSGSCPSPFTPGEIAPLDRKPGGPQSRSGWSGDEKIFAPTGTRTPTPRPSSLQPGTISTAPSRLRCTFIAFVITETQ
jgi:hypothetical protein